MKIFLVKETALIGGFWVICFLVMMLMTLFVLSFIARFGSGAEQEAKMAEGNEQPTPQQIAYGNALFFAKTLSTTGEKACASCHLSERAGVDAGPVSIGVTRNVRDRRGRVTGQEEQQGIRRAETVEDAVFKEDNFWDGRAKLLEGQVTQPIQAAAEMGNQTLQQAFERIAEQDYFQRKAQAAFGRGVNVRDGISAMAMFERTIVHDEAPIDRFKKGQTWVFGKIDSVLNHGRRLFYGKGRCSECHYGESYTDHDFHNILGRTVDRNNQLDLGRGKITGRQEDNFKFVTPTLRDIAKRAPYFHAGQAKDMEEAVHFVNVYLQLSLTDEDEADLSAFMKVAFESYHPPTYAKPADMPDDL